MTSLATLCTPECHKWAYSRHQLTVPRVRCITFGCHSFASAGPIQSGIHCLTMCVACALDYTTHDYIKKSTKIVRNSCTNRSSHIANFLVSILMASSWLYPRLKPRSHLRLFASNQIVFNLLKTMSVHTERVASRRVTSKSNLFDFRERWRASTRAACQVIGLAYAYNGQMWSRRHSTRVNATLRDAFGVNGALQCLWPRRYWTYKNSQHGSMLRRCDNIDTDTHANTASLRRLTPPSLEKNGHLISRKLAYTSRFT